MQVHSCTIHFVQLSVGKVNCDPLTFLGVTDLTLSQTASDPQSSVTDHVLGRMGAELDIM